MGPTEKEINDIVAKKETVPITFKAHGIKEEVTVSFNPSTDFNPELEFPIRIESGKLVVEFSIKNSSGSLYFSSEF